MVTAAPKRNYLRMCRATEEETEQFYSLTWGSDRAEIPRTRGSLICLPIQAVDYKLIASYGPENETLTSFWGDLVLARDTTLIVNLCQSCGDSWRDESCQYWPKEVGQTVIDKKRKVTVNCLQI